MTSITTTDRAAHTDAPVLDVIAQRWSPRAFDPAHTVTQADLEPALEALRWAPSANNSQPWRVIVGRRGGEAFETIVGGLVDFNAQWARNASALVVTVAKTVSPTGTPIRWAEYDLGQAAAFFALQAQAQGLYTHTMGGFDAQAIHRDFALGDDDRVVSVIAVGALGDPAELNEVLAAREVAPRERRSLNQTVLRAD